MDNSSLEEGEIPDTEIQPDDSADQVHVEQIEAPPEKELDKVWKKIESGTPDWATWTKLLSLTDNEETIEVIRKAYDTFLTEFPLCYVYWKKYADHEMSKGSPHRVFEIYERALTHSIPHSVDLWTQYCSHFAEKSDNLDAIRSLFERAAKIVGNDFIAHPLWDRYIEFETSQEELKRVGQLYTRIMLIPLEQITTYWERYKKLIASTKNIEDLVSDEELRKMTELDLQTIEKQKSWLISEREKDYLKTTEEVNMRRIYERELLKVNYFHVRPLDESQLINWLNYLEFEEIQGNHERIVKLYERCIIPCCNYTKYWLKYIRYLEKYGLEKAKETKENDNNNNNYYYYTADEARSVFDRACNIYLKKRPDIHLEYALFEEQYGNIDRARAIYEKLSKIVPGHVESILRYIALEKRQKNFVKCEQLYMNAISSSNEELNTLFLYIHYARAIGSVYESPKRAREIFIEGTKKLGKYKEIWLAYAQFEKSLGGDDVEERVSQVYSQALYNNKAISESELLSIMLDWIEYCNDEGTNIKKIRELSNDYRDMHNTYEKNTTSFKRTMDHHHPEQPPAKVARKSYEMTTVPPTIPAATAPISTDTSSADYSAYYQNDYGSSHDTSSNCTNINRHIIC
eukprot:TRINITY_DN7620_c0_g1_i3.p1 TRINITY_DN7620_c0_g1~~TRINITY_DN7620_c0_g1_i3.p1  ORF type:complete len:640 (-),score=131.51 TRINITY_DN7620_c0_g1_i3:226-2115(-)